MHDWARLLSLSLLIYLSSAADPVFPKLRDLAETFESSTELTDLNQRTTALAKEYYDFEKQTGRLEVLALGQKLTYFFNGVEDQVFTVNDTACKENDGGVAEIGMNFYGWTTFEPPYVGPSALIMRKFKEPPVFVNKTFVRSIKCDWFRSSTSGNGRYITLDYYFAVPEWDMPFTEGANNKRFPVRIIVSYLDEDDRQDEIIDYLYFRPKLNDKSKLQSPVGLGCWMKKPTVELPTLPKQYSFSVEEFDLQHDAKHAETDVTTATLWYDYGEKFARIDRFTSEGKISDLHDFKTGILYHTHDDRTCVVKHLRNSFFLKFDPDSLIGQMKDKYEVLNMQGDDETFYTMGQDEVRGVKCDVIEKVERDVYFFDVRYKLLVTTVYLSTESTKIQVDGENLSFNPPFKILITGYEELNKVSLKKQYQIFAFDDEPGMKFFSTFPSDQCFAKSNQKSYFVIRIDAPLELTIEEMVNDTVFTILAKDTIMAQANITEFRLPFLRADFRLSGIYLTGLMLDKPPNLEQFWKLYDEPQFTKETSAYTMDLDSADEESCATACLGYSEPCTGFHFCGKGCYINLGELTDTPVDPVPLNQDCYVYIRTVRDSRNDQSSLKEALNRLDTAVKNKKLSFRIQVKGEPALIAANEFVKSFNNRGGDDVTNFPYTLVKAGFQFKAEKDTTTEIPGVLSEEDCYRQCKESTFTSCSSFSYCPKDATKKCRLTSVLLTGGSEDNDEIDPNVQCDIFSLLYLDFFDRYPGKVLSLPGKKNVDEAYSTETCAKACREETGFRCRGFEYCKSEEQSSCVLHEKHVLDLKPNESKPAKAQCTHYAAKFIADYRDKGTQLIDDDSDTRTDITLEECARACSEEVQSCNSFNYCPATEPTMTDSSCSLTSKTIFNSKKKTKDKCRLYTKRENVEDWKPAPRKSTSGYTKGGFTGLLIGMIIFGLVVGALLFVGYSYYRSRHGGGDGLSVKFSKHENM